LEVPCGLEVLCLERLLDCFDAFRGCGAAVAVAEDEDVPVVVEVR
jgi:hypothetical protein